CVVSLARLRPVRGRRTRVKHVTGLTGLDEAFHHSWYQSKVVVMADRRDWGGGGDDLEESTQRMIERIWESLTDIQMRMDQHAPVPPVVGEAVPVAPVPPSPWVENVEPELSSRSAQGVRSQFDLRGQVAGVKGAAPPEAKFWLTEVKQSNASVECISRMHQSSASVECIS
ncbi:hypothetical protein Taro_005820, partial [Colocasia esculenta]|nr:hypothetical protein [Colocasia esculenta]